MSDKREPVWNGPRKELSGRGKRTAKVLRQVQALSVQGTTEGQGHSGIVNNAGCDLT